MSRFDPRRDPWQPEFYEGLVRKTASKYERSTGVEYEDLCQTFREKVLMALRSFDPARATQPIEGYVFSCVRNKVTDLHKKKNLSVVYIEDQVTRGRPEEGPTESTDRFELLFAEDEDVVFAEVLAETPLIPSTLSRNERRVLVCMYLGLGQAEAASRFSLSRREVARAVKGIKAKMADWAPRVAEQPIAAGVPEAA